MTDIQRIEREMLCSFVDICHKLNLRYYLVCGSALGAVKYGGFIPWDDDIDVALPRGDYERFLREAPGLLPGHLFLQNYRTDPAFPQIYSKLRHSGTTCFEESARYLPINHGIFLDIFPLDGYPASRFQQAKLALGKWWYRRLLNTAYREPPGLLPKWEHRTKRLLGLHRHTAKIAGKLDTLLRAVPAENAEIWCNHGNWQGTLEYMPQSWFGQGREARFEGIPVTIPGEAERYLTQKYGDYRADPPVQASHHRFLLVDCENPYTMYQKGDGPWQSTSV